MKADFAYIDDAVSTLCERELKEPTIERDGLKVKATRVIAGFHIHDPKEEDRLVAEAMKGRRSEVERFQADRDAAAHICSERSIVPLAIVPLSAWATICRSTELYRLAPSADGRVGFSPDAFSGLKAERRITVEDQIEHLAKTNWPAFLRRLFPNFVSVAPSSPAGYQQSLSGLQGSQAPWQNDFIEVRAAALAQQHLQLVMAQAMHPAAYQATLVMPVPPADVAETLLRAQGIPGLKVAAVADAIGFKETPTQLFHAVRSAEEAAARVLRDDPIVYFEHGSAAAIIAQFGDFPIEREVVDRVVSAQTALRFFPQNVSL